MPQYAKYGFNNADFYFSGNGGTLDADGRCVVEYELPDYEIESILTGQILPGEPYRLWEARFFWP